MYPSLSRWGWIFGAALGLLVPDLPPGMAKAEGKSDLALVLAVDASGSIDTEEFSLQLNGIANAFRQREVVTAIQSGRAGAIEVALLLWGGEITETISSGWYRVSTEREAEAFAAHVAVHPRRAYGTTAVGNGIMAALALLGKVAQRADRLCIDVSGDGRETVSRSRRHGITPTKARSSAERSQVTINALAIESEETDLREWYRLNIITGDGFVMAIDRVEAFGTAIQSKLIKEIRPLDVANAAPARSVIVLEQGLSGYRYLPTINAGVGVDGTQYACKHCRAIRISIPTD